MPRGLASNSSCVLLVGRSALVMIGIVAAGAEARSDDLPRRGYFGTEIRTPTLADRERRQLPAGEDGVLVDRVLPDSSAERAGLQPGDFLVSVDGQSIASPSRFIEALAARRPGEAFSVVVVRDGQRSTKQAELKTRPIARDERRAPLDLRIGDQPGVEAAADDRDPAG